MNKYMYVKQLKAKKSTGHWAQTLQNPFVLPQSLKSFAVTQHTITTETIDIM